MVSFPREGWPRTPAKRNPSEKRGIHPGKVGDAIPPPVGVTDKRRRR